MRAKSVQQFLQICIYWLETYTVFMFHSLPPCAGNRSRPMCVMQPNDLIAYYNRTVLSTPRTDHRT